MEHTIIQSAKHYIQIKDLASLQHYWQELQEQELQVDVPSLFQKIYLHACLKCAPDIAHWLRHTVYPTLDPIIQIALRQMFPYGEVLLKKCKGV